MASIRIPCLVARTNGAGLTSWYWQPSATLRAAGWKPLALGKDESAAINAARRRNEDVATWKAGGGKPREVRKREAAGTVGALIARYRREVVQGRNADGMPAIAATTAKTYETSLKRLDIWAGKHPVAFITPARVRALRDAMMKPVEKGGIGHYPAHKTLVMGRTLFAFAKSIDLVERNPFEDFGLAAPAPRDVIWSPEAHAAMVAMADARNMPSVALAIVLGFAIGQREGDLLALTQTKFVEIPRHKMQAEDYDQLVASAADDRVMGFRVRQKKTRAWVEVPVIGDVRARVEAAIARARAGRSAAILLDDTRGTDGHAALYHGEAGQTRFQRDFADIREAAAAHAKKEGDGDLAAELLQIQFRDLRRTCVVYLGELGLDAHLIAAITGHDIDETQAILKTYMPRTTGRAARAIAMSQARDLRTTERKEQQG